MEDFHKKRYHTLILDRSARELQLDFGLSTLLYYSKVHFDSDW